MNSFDGKKTYIAAILTAIFNAAVAFGLVSLSPEEITAINGVLIAAIGAALRHGVAKSS